jgi:hypothetical protein
MVQSSDRRGDTPRTLFKIILMLGLALVGVAAMAAEPQQNETAENQTAQTETASTTTCAETKFAFGGRIIENGEVTDTWTLTCWREPKQEAAMPAPAAKPIDALPVSTQPVRQLGLEPGSGRF